MDQAKDTTGFLSCAEVVAQLDGTTTADSADSSDGTLLPTVSHSDYGKLSADTGVNNAVCERGEENSSDTVNTNSSQNHGDGSSCGTLSHVGVVKRNESHANNDNSLHVMPSNSSVTVCVNSHDDNVGQTLPYVAESSTNSKDDLCQTSTLSNTSIYTSQHSLQPSTSVVTNDADLTNFSLRNPAPNLVNERLIETNKVEDVKDSNNATLESRATGNTCVKENREEHSVNCDHGNPFNSVDETGEPSDSNSMQSVMKQDCVKKPSCDTDHGEAEVGEAGLQTSLQMFDLLSSSTNNDNHLSSSSTTVSQSALTLSVSAGISASSTLHTASSSSAASESNPSTAMHFSSGTMSHDSSAHSEDAGSSEFSHSGFKENEHELCDKMEIVSDNFTESSQYSGKCETLESGKQLTTSPLNPNANKSETFSPSASASTTESHVNSSSSGEGACKILTKYVYISKPSKMKSKKKSFGLLYRQAFKHYVGKKAIKKKTIKQNKVKDKPAEYKPPKKSVVSRKKQIRCVADPDLGKRQLKEVKNRLREERRLAREDKKNKSAERSKADKAKHKADAKKDRKSRKQGKRKGGESSAALKQEEKKTSKKNLRKSTDNRKKSSVKKPVKDAVVGRARKRKAENLPDADAKRVESKRKKRYKERKEVVEVKQETMEDDAVLFDVGDLGMDQSMDFDSGTSDGRSFPFNYGGVNGKLRNRKDLTLQEKVQVIKELELPGSKVVSVARKYGVSVSAISRISKNKEYILLQSVSGDMSGHQRRTRECKDPALDMVLLRWYRTFEYIQDNGTPFTLSNILLKEKAHELAVMLGRDYFPTDSWIMRWKTRHNIGSTKTSKLVMMIQDREEFKKLDEKVNISDIIEEMGKHTLIINQVKKKCFIKGKFMTRPKKPEEFIVCQHCGVLVSNRKKRENLHEAGCPASSVRKDLTLEEKAQVVRALEQPGIKMIALAKKFGVSASAISRIHKNRVDILARQASGSASSTRRRDRVSKEPEVERLLCDWFRTQYELGIHISGMMIREKARELAASLGRDFWPSESWVFRWRHRNNVMYTNAFLYGDSDEETPANLERNNDNAEDVDVPKEESGEVASEVLAEGGAVTAGSDAQIEKKEVGDGEVTEKRVRFPRSVMCEKCGFVSSRVKNNRIKSLRHAKGCPDLKIRTELTYENRAKMLKALEEPGATLSSVARDFGVSVSSMSRMNQKKEIILSHMQDHGGQKRIRDCKEPQVAYNLYRWFMEQKASGIHVTGPKLKEKAKKLAAEMGREFNASSGWLARWRTRYNIVGSVRNNENKTPRILTKRKKSNKKPGGAKSEAHSSELTQLQPMGQDLHQDSIGSTPSVIVEPLEPVPPPPPQAAPVFIHQRFQNPWEVAHQQTGSCVWTTKEFLNPQGPSIPEEATAAVSYTYADSIPKPVFHNMFDSFSAVGYPLAMSVDSNMVGRDYLKSDNSDDKCGPSGLLIPPHTTHPTHIQHGQHIPASLTTQSHLQHQIPVSLPPPHPNSTHIPHADLQSHIPSHSQQTHPLPPPSPAGLEEDPEQQRKVMEAFKIMSSFAQKKSLGDQVQAALRTIEMSMKNPSRKQNSRNTYTTI